MNYKIVHISERRVRIALPISCTLEVQNYIETLCYSAMTVEKIHFYNDLKHVSIFQESINLDEIDEFFKKVCLLTIKECYQNSTIARKETPYNIISMVFYKRMFTKLFIPFSIRKIGVLLKILPFTIEAMRSISKLRLDMSVLDFLAIFVSIFTGDYQSASTIIFLLNLGNQLDHWSQKKSIEDLEQALKNSTEEVWMETPEGRVKKRLSQVKKEDVLIFSEGNEILFDGEVIRGEALVDESSLTGESYPLSKKVGDKVLSNTIVKAGELVVLVENEQAHARLLHLVQLITEADLSKNTKQKKLIDRADKLVKFNFIGMVLTFLFTRSVPKTLSFLLVDFSCAIKLSTPIVYLTAMKEALNHQVLVKNSSVLDVLPEVETYIFDKTGTLTTSQPEIQKILTFNDHSEEEVLRIGACLEEHIYHPIATAVVNKAAIEGIEHKEMHGELQHVNSMGIRSSIEGTQVLIGSKKFLLEEKISFSESQLQLISGLEDQYNLLYLSHDTQLIAIFCVNTPLRPEAKPTLEALKEEGKKLVLLTGDTAKRTYELSNQLPFDQVLTDIKPEEKHGFVVARKEAKDCILMVGDGLNDAAAIAQADIGVVMGSSSDISKQTSDIILLSDNLQSIQYLNSLTKKMDRKLTTNLSATLKINGLLILLGLMDALPSKSLVLLHNLSTFSIIGNSFSLTDKSTKADRASYSLE